MKLDFFNEFSFGITCGPVMLVKYANIVKIQPIAPDKSANQSFQFTSYFNWAFIFKII